ncbi:tetratricopeptide [Colletotrichum higginsianum]|uniref:Tetratricopeptide n=1 Tax=Colletotrichum higginsianum (strain IMI 349063) TaxID=759273 RepID=H1V3C7_COLHI|nr:Tetratricopeptide [Colletotrichum higginsianum IMI 349063]OBR12020.1 Tetratricopeptide [Colletotrichum higginsianum IMI 349063]CCF34729.1 tetratricopeptide [Colletotrichum higginsianum]
MSLNENELSQLRESLQDAVVKCSERAAELLNAIPEPSADAADATDADSRYVPTVLTPNADPEEALLEAREINKYLLAKAFFDTREFDRCAAVFLPDSVMSSVLSSNPEGVSGSSKGKGKAKGGEAETTRAAGSSTELPRLSQKSLFLALYAKFMAGEKRKDEDSEMVMGPQDLGNVINKQLNTVSRFLSNWFDERTTDDGEVLGSQGWLEYLYGMVLAKEKNEDRAMDYFVRSVHLYPMNWGCWLEMTQLISRVDDLGRIAEHLPQNIVSFIWHLYTSLELYQATPELANSLDSLMGIFPDSSFLLTCNAMLTYHSKDLVAAEQHFSRLLSLHPHRLDSLDHYSNILYVMNLRPKLAFLAHLCSSIDKFRPESCVVVGNYYSLLSMHEKAVHYFRRALTLDRTCLSAWTLMGHEYVEMKNTHAAIESYRRAVDANRRDYRAWYGLGQAYEMLEMHTYSLWYYKKAAGLRPWDGKMWLAVGSCLQKMGRDQDGIKALKRALLAEAYYDSGNSFGSGGDFLSSRGATGHLDPELLFQIASMYDHLGDEEEAKAYMELCLAQEGGEPTADNALNESIAIHNDSPGASDDEGNGDGLKEGANEGTGVTASTSKARMWLAKHAMRTADYATANRLGTELTQDGFEVEEAKALVREARVRIRNAEPGLTP